MRLYKLLIKDDGESCPMAVGIYSDIATANRAKELCPGSFLMNLPLDYIPKGCPEGMLAWVVNVDCSEGLVTSEQVDVFSVKGGFAPSEHYYLNLWEDPGEICVAMWAKSKGSRKVSLTIGEGSLQRKNRMPYLEINAFTGRLWMVKFTFELPRPLATNVSLRTKCGHAG